MTHALALTAFFPVLVCVLSSFSPRAAQQATPEQLQTAVWVEGQVTLPADTPADERVVITAHANGLPSFNDHASELDDARRFKVAFAHDARRGLLQVQGRYVFTTEEARWRRGTDATDVSLSAQLGAWLCGRVILPDSVPALPAGEEVVLHGVPRVSGGVIIERRARIAADRTFAVGGLSCDYAWSARIVAHTLQPLVVETIDLAPGRRTDVEWTLSRGVLLSGRAVDEQGAPVAGVRIEFDCRSEPLAPLPLDAADGCVTAADGSFAVRGLYPGDVLLRASRAGWLTTAFEIKALKNADVRSGIEIVMRSGLVLRGHVVDPAGEPVSEARVSVTQATPGEAPLARELVTDSAGSFHCPGLSEAPVRIAVVRTVGTFTWKAARADVDPRQEDLVIAVAARHKIKGRVLDDLGRTILRYTAGVQRAGVTDPHAPARTIDVKNKDGLFEIDDLEAGEWDVFAFGRGLIYEPARRVAVPYTGEPLVFVVRRPATVAGRVLNADRSPAAGAVVEVEWERASVLGGVINTERANVRASPEGKFEITEVFPGRVRVFAATEDGRVSVPFALAMNSGEKRTDVEVVLAP